MKRSSFNKRISIVYFSNMGVDEIGDTIEPEKNTLDIWAAVRDQYASDIKATAGTIYQNTIQFLVEDAIAAFIERIERKDLFINYGNDKYKIVRITRDPLKNKHSTVYAEKF